MSEVKLQITTKTVSCHVLINIYPLLFPVIVTYCSDELLGGGRVMGSINKSDTSHQCSYQPIVSAVTLIVKCMAVTV